MGDTARTFEGQHSTLVLTRPVHQRRAAHGSAGVTTADFVRRFAELGDAMLIYTDGAAFDEALRKTTTR